MAHQIELKNFGKFERGLAKLIRTDKSYLHSLGRACVDYLRQASIDIRYKGEFQNGWDYRIEGDSVQVFNRALHAPYVEGGRGPGRWPPIDKMREWALAKFGVDVGYV